MDPPDQWEVSVFWSAAGSEAPRRFGFGARARGRSLRGVLGRAKAPSPLRSAGALQKPGLADGGLWGVWKLR